MISSNRTRTQAIEAAQGELESDRLIKLNLFANAKPDRQQDRIDARLTFRIPLLRLLPHLLPRLVR